MDETGSLPLDDGLELAAIPIILVAADGAVVWANLQAQEWIGVSLKQMRQQGVAARPIRGPKLQERIERMLDAPSDLSLLRQDLGDSAIVDLHGRWTEARQTLTVTIIPHAHAQPAAPEAAALGFGRMLAHELKNPLASVRGAAQLIARSDGGEDVSELANLIIEDVDRMTRLADHWSGIGDVTMGETSRVNLNRIAVAARDSVERAGRSRGIRLVERFDPSLPASHGDPILLHQAVQNLIQNACDAVREGGDGEICIETRFDPGPESRAEGSHSPLVIAVHDNGAGVPENLATGIFTPFVTSKPAGEGLGLAFTARIAALHNGLIDYQSEPGRTVFNLRLPVADKD